MRAVVDTSVWVSALLNPAGPPAQILSALQQERFIAVVSEPLLDEIERVLARPRLLQRLALSPTTLVELVSFLRQRGEMAPVTGALDLCRDPTDDMVAETALHGHADVLVSRDDDLKGAPEFVAALQSRGVAALTVRHFLARLGEVATPQT